MIDMKRIAAGTALAGVLGIVALGIGSGVANAAPAPGATGSSFAEDPGWGHGPGPWGHGDGGWNNGRRWAPPPPPPPYYGGYQGGYNSGYNGGYNGGGCITGPFGLLHFGNC